MVPSNEILNFPFPLILFDGVCNLCTGSVQFVLKRDSKKQFRFASLQSETGQKILKTLGLSTMELKTFLLVEEGRAYFKSTGFLRVTRRLRPFWPLLTVFVIVPRFIRDAIYDFIARHRYRWFGKKEACWVPTPELRERFLGG